MPPVAAVRMRVWTPERLHEADGEDNLVERPALVVVEPPLEEGDGRAGEAADVEPAGVARDGGLGHVGNLGVGEDGGGFESLGQLAQAGAEDYGG